MKFVFFTIFAAVYSQLIVKWRVGEAGPLPSTLGERVKFVAALLCDPWIITGILATFLSGVSWMIAMTKVELSYAYPFIGLVFVLILISSSIFFHEAITTSKIIGVVLVIVGILVVSRG
jgi:multidrug transporter EmrE-like cation transporter